MNYINKVIIENFQSHEKSVITFSTGLNVIVGPSDQGKSAIIRAIKWVLFNQPRGNEFIRHGSNYARVTIEMSNGTKVIRERSSSKNRYTVVYSDDSQSVFEGFGNEVPLEVQNAHGILKVVLDTDSNVSLNLGEQLEGPFLLSETGSMKARAIGRLTGVHIIDKAIRDCISDIKSENQTESKCKKEIEEIDQKLKEFDLLNKLGEEIKMQERILARLEAKVNQLNTVENKKKSLIHIEEEIRTSSSIVKMLSNIDKAELVIEKLMQLVMKLSRMNNLRTRASFINYEHRLQEETIKSTVNIKRLSEEIKKIDSKIIRFRQIKQLSDRLTKLDQSINEGLNYIKKVKDEIVILMNDYEKQLKKISRCPLCFNTISDETVNNILLQYKEDK